MGDGASPQTVPVGSPQSSGRLGTSQLSATLTATTCTASLEMESSALTLLEAVDLATVTLVAPWCRRLVARPLVTSGPRSELFPLEHLLDVRLACPLDSPGPSTTWTGSSPRLECLEHVLAADVHFPRKDLKIKDLLHDPGCPRTFLNKNMS